VAMHCLATRPALSGQTRHCLPRRSSYSRRAPMPLARGRTRRPSTPNRQARPPNTQRQPTVTTAATTLPLPMATRSGRRLARAPGLTMAPAPVRGRPAATCRTHRGIANLPHRTGLSSRAGSPTEYTQLAVG